MKIQKTKIKISKNMTQCSEKITMGRSNTHR